MPRKIRIGYARDYRVSGDGATYTLSGQAASLRRAAKVDAAQGAYTLTGQDATLATTGATDSGWAATVPTITFTQGVAAARDLTQYTAGFNTTLHEMQIAESSPNPLPSGITLNPAGSLVYDGVGALAPIVNVQIDIENKAVYAQLVETDRTSWLNASGSGTWGGLNLPWLNAGGDWRDANNTQNGSTPYATGTVSAFGAQNVTFSVAALATRLLANNTGIHIQLTGADINTSSRTGSQPPTLQIVTNTGTFNCTCTVSFRINSSSNQSIFGTDDLKPTLLLKFDLSAVTGTVSAATLTLRVTNVFTGSFPRTLSVNYLDMPRLYYNLAAEVGGAVQGIANSVAQDTALSSHPSVLAYDDLSSDAVFYGATRRFVTVNNGIPRGEGAAGHYFESLPQYGLTAFVVKSATSGPGIVDIHRWCQPTGVEPEPSATWRRPYTKGQQLGHTHLFFRYLMWIGEDLYAGFNEGGMKLSSLAGSYDWGTSGSPTEPPPRDDAKAHYRSWHSGKSDAAPHFYHFGTYTYDPDNPTTTSPNGRVDMANVVRGTCFRAGRWYCIEQELKLNTLTGLGLDDPNGLGIANVNADGIERYWIDGVKVFEYTNRRVRGTPEVNIQSIPYLTIYHGGLTPPLAPFTYKLAGVCVSTQYIGPPKVIA